MLLQNQGRHFYKGEPPYPCIDSSPAYKTGSPCSTLLHRYCIQNHIYSTFIASCFSKGYPLKRFFLYLPRYWQMLLPSTETCSRSAQPLNAVHRRMSTLAARRIAGILPCRDQSILYISATRTFKHIAFKNAQWNLFAVCTAATLLTHRIFYLLRH